MPEAARWRNFGVTKFVHALAADWFARMSGPLSVPFAIAAIYVPNETARVLLLATAFVCAWAAAYRVWKVQYERANTAEDEIEKLKAVAPDLRPEIIGVAFGGTNERTPNDATVILFVKITNLGTMQSSADQFRAFSTRDGVSKRLRLMAIPGFIRLGTKNPKSGTNVIVEYLSDQSLHRKTATPIQVGASVTGILIGTIGVAEKASVESGAEITVIFEDVKGKLSFAKRMLNINEVDDVQDFFGIEGKVVG
jgi:hypothetical protein